MDNERAELEAQVSTLSPEEQEALLNIPRTPVSTPEVSVNEQAVAEPEPAKEDLNVPEKFQKEDGTVDTEKVLKSYSELEKQYHSKAQQKQPVEAQASVEPPASTSEDDPWKLIDDFVERKLSQKEVKSRELQIAQSDPEFIDALFRKNEERIAKGLAPLPVADAYDARELAKGSDIQKALKSERKALEQSVHDQQKAQVEGARAAASREPASINDLVNKANSQKELTELRGFLEDLVR